tara:strand:- start:45 stop:350 length:306 start_codon:yes stop_codon:yes gene_type:complete
MKDLDENKKIKNCRQIRVKFYPCTNKNGARIKIYEPKRWVAEKQKTKFFSYDYAIGDIKKQGYKILTKNGYNIIAYGCELGDYIFLCDDWGYPFKQIEDLK